MARGTHHHHGHGSCSWGVAAACGFCGGLSAAARIDVGGFSPAELFLSLKYIFPPFSPFPGFVLPAK